MGENHGAKGLAFLPDPYLDVKLGPQKLLPLFETLCGWEHEADRAPPIELGRRMARVKEELPKLTGVDATWRQNNDEERFAFFQFMVVCVYSQNLYAGMLAAQSDIDSMPVNLAKRRAQADPATLTDEAPPFKRIQEGELAMEGCNLIIQGPEKNVHIILRSAFPEPALDGKGTAHCYTGRVVDKQGVKKEFFRLQRSELVKMTGMELKALGCCRPGPKAFVA